MLPRPALVDDPAERALDVLGDREAPVRLQHDTRRRVRDEDDRRLTVLARDRLSDVRRDVDELGLAAGREAQLPHLADSTSELRLDVVRVEPARG